MEITGVSHVALTVSDFDRSKEWYGKVLGWSPVFEGEGDGQRFAFGFLGGGVGLALRQHLASAGEPFTPDRTGLDHLAFQVGSRADLDEWEKRFAEHGVAYTPTIDEGYGHVLNFKDPDNIALEVFALKS